MEEYSFKIYKKDSKGKIRVLHVHTEGADLIQESGILDGKLVVHRSTCTGKNIGRSNETTPVEQAKLEAASKIETKMSTGYFNSADEAENEVVILPMLAKDYGKEKNKIVYPCYSQPKLDGMRALGKPKGGLISRKGKVIETMLHLQVELDTIPITDLLDGELYAHGKTFQENMRIIKKYRFGETEKVKFHVYDMVLDGPFIKRYNVLTQLVSQCPNIEVVKTTIIHSEEQLKEVHEQNIADGYEGTIVRHSDAGYGINKRDSQLLKYKDFIDDTYRVIDIVPSEKDPEQGVVHCAGLATNNGMYLSNFTFGCGMKFSHKERKEMLINKSDYIGQMAEIRFFEYSDDGVPRFPVCHGFRLDK